MWKQKLKIDKYTANDKQSGTEIVLVEKAFELVVNGTSVLSELIVPGQEIELAIGYLACKGHIQDTSQMTIKDHSADRLIVEIPNQAPIEPQAVPDITLKSSDIYRLTAEFQEKSLLYKQTSIAHSAAVADTQEIRQMAQDIGRLNAVDKALGTALSEKQNLSGAIILVSGKICRNLVQKAVHFGCSGIVSRLAPTAGAVLEATQAGVILIGFARGVRFSVYTEKSRVHPG